MKHFLGLLLLAFTATASAQNAWDDPNYLRATKIGLGELQKGQCAPCLEAYDRAIALHDKDGVTLLRAACCAQMCHDDTKAKVLADKAVAVAPAIVQQVLGSPADYPELRTFQQSDLGKKTRKKASETIRPTLVSPKH